MHQTSRTHPLTDRVGQHGVLSMRSRSFLRMSGTSLLGLTIGVGAGAAAALMVAPMRGPEMRANLRARAREANASAQRYTASTRSWARETLDRGRRRIEEARHKSVTPTLGAQS